MKINQNEVSGNLGGKNEILREVAARFKQIIDFGCNEADEQKMREKLDAKIQAKLESGKRLSEKELNYLRKYNPQMYAHALRILL